MRTQLPRRTSRCRIGLLAAVLALATLLPTPAFADDARVFHVTPSGGGAGDGATWRSAGTLADVPRFVGQADPGDEIWIRGDQGSYRTNGAVVIRDGGTSGRPVTIRGVDGRGGSSATPRLVGTRTSPYRVDGNPGGELFKLLSGADHLTFTNLAFVNQGNGAFRVGADIRDLRLHEMRATNVRRFLENYPSGDEPSATITGLHISDVRVDGFSKGAIRLRDDTNDVRIEDVVGDSQRQDGDNFAMGLLLEGTVHDVVVRDVTMRNSRDSGGPRDYWNGDGFVAERGTHDLLFTDTVADGNTDGGYDLKSTDTTLVRASATGNKRNFRFWADVTVFGCRGDHPVHPGGTGGRTQVWAGEGSTVDMVGCAFGDRAGPAPVFSLEDDASVSTVTTALSGALRDRPTSDQGRLDWVALDEAVCAEPPTAPPFTDIDGNHHENQIACAAERGLARGRQAGVYAPDDAVTRAQMASFVTALLAAAHDGPATDGAAEPFPDVGASPHADAIADLAATGIVSGYADGTYRPNAPVTRAQMAAFVDRVREYLGGQPTDDPPFDAFTDDDGTTHERSINRVAGAGIAVGGLSGRYQPQAPVTRAQMATFLVRTLGAVTLAASD